ncbi:MAG: outer membrane beta-barrel protein [Cryomorphaceae bacterium]
MRIFSIIICFVVLGGSLSAQNKYKPLNLGKFDKKQYHFGFLLGFNNATFYIDRKAELDAQDSLLSVTSTNPPGFNLGIIASWNITKNISLRFTPTLSFEDRTLNYVFHAAPDSTVAFEKRVESTFIDFPINLKLRTNRLRNTAFYAVGGARYRINMQSEEDVNNQVADDIIVKTISDDFVVEFGGGIDLFLQYFKFGIELKIATGIPNLLVPEDTQFSNPIESLRSRTFFLTLTFEG